MSSWPSPKLNFRTSIWDIAGNGVNVYSSMSIGIVNDTQGRAGGGGDGMHNDASYCHQPEHLKHQCARQKVNNESKIEYKETHACMCPRLKRKALLSQNLQSHSFRVLQSCNGCITR